MSADLLKGDAIVSKAPTGLLLEDDINQQQ